MISAWRITKQKHAKTAFTGEGAKLYGGRWNSPGRPVVYVAQSRALALAEILVHLESAQILSSYVLFEAQIDESHIAVVDLDALPKNWKNEPAPARLQSIGDEWLASATSVALRVPSAIIVGEFNYLLNPLHRDFSRIEICGPEKFLIDRRLIKE